MDDSLREQIEGHVNRERIMLFMKGTPAFPQCGFSNQVIQILRFHKAEFGTVNVLDEPEVREGIKEFSDWPTIPQLYVAGEFVGGCDILMEMHNNGELSGLLSAS